MELRNVFLLAFLAFLVEDAAGLTFKDFFEKLERIERRADLEDPEEDDSVAQLASEDVVFSKMLTFYQESVHFFLTNRCPGCMNRIGKTNVIQKKVYVKQKCKPKKIFVTHCPIPPLISGSKATVTPPAKPAPPPAKPAPPPAKPAPPPAKPAPPPAKPAPPPAKPAPPPAKPAPPPAKPAPPPAKPAPPPAKPAPPPAKPAPPPAKTAPPPAKTAPPPAKPAPPPAKPAPPPAKPAPPPAKPAPPPAKTAPPPAKPAPPPAKPAPPPAKPSAFSITPRKGHKESKPSCDVLNFSEPDEDPEYFDDINFSEPEENSEHFGKSCHGMSFKYRGCYRNRGRKERRTMPRILETMLNRRSRFYFGFHVDWKNYGKSLATFICRCARRALRRGYQAFGIRNRGECWSGPRAHRDYRRASASKSCLNTSRKRCDPKHDCRCVGLKRTLAVYVFD